MMKIVLAWGIASYFLFVAAVIYVPVDHLPSFMAALQPGLRSFFALEHQGCQ